MSAYLKITVCAVCVSVCALMLRRQNAELAMLLTVAGCCVCGALILELFRPVVSFAQSLYEKTGLERDLLTPLMKSLGVALASQLGASVCQDAGESAMAKLVELGGAALCLCLSLPLLGAVLSLISQLAG